MSAGALPAEAIAAPPALQLEGISKSFAGVPALRDVSITVRAGEIHALLGHNGAGKSVLMKTLMGVHQPDSGAYSVNGEPVRFASPLEAQRQRVSMVYQEFGLVPQLPVYENVCLSSLPTRNGVLRRREAIERSAEILASLGSSVSPTAIVGELKVADQQEVEIARALSLDPLVLIMDEPTAALSHSETSRLFELVVALRERGVAIVYITHKLDEVIELADRATVMRDGRTQGTFEVSDVSAALLVEKITGREIATTAGRRHAPATTADPALELEDLRVDDVVLGIDLQVRRGEVVGVAGLVGAGKTEIAKAVVGALPPESVVSGSCKIKGRTVDLLRTSPVKSRRLGIGFVPEDRKAEGILAEESVMENLMLPALGTFRRWGAALDWRAGRRASEQVMGDVNVRPFQPLKPVKLLSGGNQQKVVIGKWLVAGTDLLILDEPTRGVDVGARAEIYRVIRDLASDGLGVLVLSSDLEEILLASDRIVAMRRGQVVANEPADELSEARLLDLVAGTEGLR